MTDGALQLLSQAGLLPVLAQGELGGEAGSGPGARAQKHFLRTLEGPPHRAPVATSVETTSAGRRRGRPGRSPRATRSICAPAGQLPGERGAGVIAAWWVPVCCGHGPVAGHTQGMVPAAVLSLRHQEWHPSPQGGTAHFVG